MGKLRTQVRITLLKSVPVKKMNKWIHVLIIGALDPPAIVDDELIFFAGRILEVERWEKLGIVSFETFIRQSKTVLCRIEFVANRMTIRYSIFNPKSQLTGPFFSQR